MNALTPVGIAALSATGVRLLAGNQHDPHADTHEYLYFGDAE